MNNISAILGSLSLRPGMVKVVTHAKNVIREEFSFWRIELERGEEILKTRHGVVVNPDDEITSQNKRPPK